MQRVGGWAHCLSPCITDQWNANYPSYVSIRLIWNSISCSATESRQYETSKQDDERSIAIQFLNGCTKPNILYIPLIILKFTYNRCNKVKIYEVSFIDYMLIIMFSESISTFPGTSLQNFRTWNTNLFCSLDETERVECALNTSISIPALEMVFLTHRDIVSSDAALCGFP